MTPSKPARNDGLALFFLLTFAVSWLAGWIPAALTGQPAMAFPTALLYMLGGFAPSIIGVLMVYRRETLAGRRNFWRRLVDFKAIRPGWYALIMLYFPAITALGLLINGALGGEQAGMLQWQQIAAQPSALVGALIAALLFGALSEELGWRGYALDRMAARWGFLRAALLLGLVWWAWHLPLFFIRGTTHYTWGLFTGFFWLFLANVVPLSVLIALAYARNRRSTLAAVLLHMMFNFTLALVFPLPLLAQAIITALLYLSTGALLWFSSRSGKLVYDRAAGEIDLRARDRTGEV